MKFSIIIPIYNVEQYLRDCLDSVLNQTFSDWEAICVNDGSTDGSAAILEEYVVRDKRFKIVTQSNGGLSAARNTGMEVAEGDYIVFLDSDDWLELGALETMAKNLDGEDMLCFSGRRYFEGEKEYRQADNLDERSYSSGMEYYNENALQSRDFAFECVVLRTYRRGFLVNNNLQFKEGIYHEDDLFTPIACHDATSVRQIRACLYYYRVRAHSITTTSNPKRLRDYLEIANALAMFFIPKKGFDKIVVYRIITHHYQVVFANASIGQRKEMRRLCDWELYRKVSRTKLRHRWNYLKNRLLS